jgi:hypothetical protein
VTDNVVHIRSEVLVRGAPQIFVEAGLGRMSLFDQRIFLAVLRASRMYSRMPFAWLTHAHSHVSARAKEEGVVEKWEGLLRSRRAPHALAELAWGLAHHNTVEGLVLAASVVLEVMKVARTRPMSPSRIARLRTERRKVLRRFYEPQSESWLLDNLPERMEIWERESPPELRVIGGGAS